MQCQQAAIPLPTMAMIEVHFTRSVSCQCWVSTSCLKEGDMKFNIDGLSCAGARAQ